MYRRIGERDSSETEKRGIGETGRKAYCSFGTYRRIGVSRKRFDSRFQIFFAALVSVANEREAAFAAFKRNCCFPRGQVSSASFAFNQPSPLLQEPLLHPDSGFLRVLCLP